MDDPFTDSSDDDSVELARIRAKLQKQTNNKSKHFGDNDSLLSDISLSSHKSSKGNKKGDKTDEFDDCSLDDEDLQTLLLPKKEDRGVPVVVTTTPSNASKMDSTVDDENWSKAMSSPALDGRQENEAEGTTNASNNNNKLRYNNVAIGTTMTTTPSSPIETVHSTPKPQTTPVKEFVFSDDSDLEDLEMEAAICKALSAKPSSTLPSPSDTSTCSSTPQGPSNPRVSKVSSVDSPVVQKPHSTVPYRRRNQVPTQSPPFEPTSDDEWEHYQNDNQQAPKENAIAYEECSDDQWDSWLEQSPIRDRPEPNHVPNGAVGSTLEAPIDGRDNGVSRNASLLPQAPETEGSFSPNGNKRKVAVVDPSGWISHDPKKTKLSIETKKKETPSIKKKGRTDLPGTELPTNSNSNNDTCKYEVCSDDDWEKYLKQPTDEETRQGGTPPSNVDAFGFSIERVHQETRSPFDGVSLPMNQNDVENAFGFSDPDSTNQSFHPQEKSLAGAVDWCETEEASGRHDERRSEVDPSLFAPEPHTWRQEPIVHRFTTQNRPKQSRRRMEVTQVFDAPVAAMFSKFTHFNHMQSELANTLAYSDDNVIVSASTGAGKTTVFEMAMARCFAVDLQTGKSGNSRRLISKRRKIVYMSPSKALCEERFEDWPKRFSAMNLGVEIAVITGDGDPSESFHDLFSAHLILTTPEKWDSLTRRWTENFFLLASVKLFLVDEVHLLGDESRGSCLESVVCRMKTIQRAASRVQVSEDKLSRSTYSHTTPEAVRSLLRFIAVSATLPNMTDMARFFDANEAYEFDESYRPVPLTTHVIGQGRLGSESKNQWHFFSNLERNVPEIINRFSFRRPTLVFCHSKKATETLADLLAKSTNIGQRTSETPQLAGQTRVSRLQRVLLQGIAYHHAGLESDDRHLIERAFLQGKIRVLCATSTLAVGVNLPAHLVIVMGTKAWRGGSGYVDINEMSLLQMVGRAGRPGFDSSGTAVIMTSDESKPKYAKLASSGLPSARSQTLGNKLVETMNVEISQRVITSMETAVDWLRSTLFFIQLVQDPHQFGASPSAVDSHVQDQCVEALQKLVAIGAVSLSPDGLLDPLPASHTMAHHLVEYNVMRQFSKLPHDANLCQVLKGVSEIESLQRPVRRSEKKLLRETHKKLKIGYKLPGALSKVTINETWKKVFVLLQVHIEDPKPALPDFTLRQEQSAMAEYASRMLHALAEFSVNGSKNGVVVYNALKLKRSLACMVWNGNHNVLRQIKGISKEMAARLALSGVGKFEDVGKFSNGEIESMANRSEPFGSDLRTACNAILGCQLKVQASIENAPDSEIPNSVAIKVEAKNPRAEASSASQANGKTPTVHFTLIVYTDRPGGLLLFEEKIVGPCNYVAPIPSTYGKIMVKLLASIVGLDGNDAVASSAFPSGSKATARSSNRIRNNEPTKRRNKPVTGKGDMRYYTKKKKAQPSTKNGQTASKALTQESKAHVPIMKSASEYVTPSPPKLSQLQQRLPTPTHQTVQSENARASSVSGFRGGSSAETSHSVLRHNLQKQERVQRQKPVSAHGFSQNETRATAPPTTRPSFAQYAASVFGRGKSTALSRVARPTPPPAQSPSQNYSTISKRAPQRETKVGTSPNEATRWKRTKHAEQKSQLRAFKHKRENPFTSFKHDPNHAESALEQLSQNTLIPKKYLNPAEIPNYRRADPIYSQNRQCPRPRSQLQVLAEKAHEQSRFGADPFRSANSFQQQTPGARAGYEYHNYSEYEEPPRRLHEYQEPPLPPRSLQEYQEPPLPPRRLLEPREMPLPPRRLHGYHERQLAPPFIEQRPRYCSPPPMAPAYAAYQSSYSDSHLYDAESNWEYDSADHVNARMTHYHDQPVQEDYTYEYMHPHYQEQDRF